MADDFEASDEDYPDFTPHIASEIFMKAIVAVAILISVLLSPIFNYVSLTTLFYCSLFASAGVAYRIILISSVRKRYMAGVNLVSYFIIGISMALLIGDTSGRGKVLNRRCIVIEREMMRGKPRRDDLPDLFQALGCRPQLSEAPRRPAD